MKFDTIILGAGAAGLMCAGIAGKSGKQILVLDHSDKIGKKIKISGGGRCNFTNLYCSKDNFTSQNRHFVISALSGYNQHDFIKLVQKHKIAFHEKTLGQLFCDTSASEIINMLVTETEQSGVTIKMNSEIANVSKDHEGFIVELKNSEQQYQSNNLVIATGGKSIPKIGATGIGYEIAKKFGHEIVTPKASLVPLIFDNITTEFIKGFQGISLKAIVTSNKKSFTESILFTHKGLSGPAILQISNYCNEADLITINLAPDHNIYDLLLKEKQESPKSYTAKILKQSLPNNLATGIASYLEMDKNLSETSNKDLLKTSSMINNWQIVRKSDEGFEKAEVTKGGVSTSDISSKTLMSQKVPGLYFIGEVLDVTGDLGGHNFQWAWSSAVAAGNNLM